VFEVHDELTGETWTWGANGNYVRFDPAERVAHVFSIT
jgi:starch synthase (maltosyl-transferring)